MPIYVFYKKPIAQRRSKTSGGLNGVERFFLPMALLIVEEWLS